MEDKDMSLEVTITKDNFEEEVLKSDKTVLIDFWAPWCTYCRRLEPAYNQAAAEAEAAQRAAQEEAARRKAAASSLTKPSNTISSGAEGKNQR